MKPPLEYRKPKSGGATTRRAKASKAKEDASQSKFDRTEYQRLYMRDQTKAKKVGMTVKQWRAGLIDIASETGYRKRQEKT